MAEKIARCGYRCDLCPAYKENAHGPDDQQRVSDGWFKYYGFRIPPEQIRCDGCRDDAPNAKRIDADCEVRRCAISRGLDTCATCRQRPCRELQSKIVSLSYIESKSGGPVPKGDYETFVRPYQAAKTLDRIANASKEAED